MRKNKLIVANWKVNGSKTLCEEYRNLSDFQTRSDLVVCPPYPYLGQFNTHSISLGSQNVSIYQSGSHTSHVSVTMLKEFGCEYCVIGHSEVRDTFGDSDSIVRAKARLLLNEKITPIICVGEDESIRNSGQHLDFVNNQLKQGLPYFEFGESVKEIVIAYEPIWAIGTGNTASLTQIEDMAREIQSMVAYFYQHFSHLSVTVLYGGSVNPNNAKEILSQPSVDGLLIGGASLVPRNMEQILSFC